MFDGELFSARAHEHHVFAFFHDLSGQADGIANPLDRGDRAGLQGGAIHNDGIELDVALAVQVRTHTRVEDRVFFQDNDRCFDGIDRSAASRKNFPAGFEGPAATFAARNNRGVRNIPCAAVDDQRWFHRVVGTRQIGSVKITGGPNTASV